MKRLIALGILLIVGIELLALIVHERRLVLAGAGVALALVLLNIRRFLGHEVDPEAKSDSEDVAGLQRWSDSSRADWDRHLRPMLARRFEIATGQRQAKDPAAFLATGRMLFGPKLWDWVNPNNVASKDKDARGPGRGALEEILLKLEQV
jgi:hypothetical protein